MGLSNIRLYLCLRLLVHTFQISQKMDIALRPKAIIVFS